MKKFIITLTLLLSTQQNLQAKETGYYQLIENKTVLNLSESAEKQVEQDRIRATLNFSHEARENNVVQNKINKAMQDAVDTAKRYKNIKTSTGRYNVHERYNNKLRANDGWKGSQEIILDSSNKDDILKLSQKLQDDGFNISGINYYLSKDKAASYRTELINEALKRVQDSAKRIATQLGAKYWHIGSVDVSNNTAPAPIHRNLAHKAMTIATSADMATPVVEGGEDTVNVTIRVAVILDMKD